MYVKDIIEALDQKVSNPTQILIISLEDGLEKYNSFWSSIPVKSVLQHSFIICRIDANLNKIDFNSISEQFQVYSYPSLLIIGPNSETITQKWVDTFPSPTEFSSYFLSASINPYMMEDDHLKAVTISVQSPNGKTFRTFYETDQLSELHSWLNVTFGPGHTYFVSHLQCQLSQEMSQTLKEAGLSPSALLRVMDKKSTQPKTPIVLQEKEDCDCKFFSALSFLNPFAEFDDTGNWEYKPSNNPDLAEAIGQNRLQ